MSEPQQWIVVRNWERFQHPDVTRSKQAPPWIRNYTELLHNPDYLELTLHQRGVLHGIWLEYATARRQLPGSTSAISRRLGERITRATLQSLVDAGFIELSASRTQAERKQPASLEEIREEPPLPPQTTNNQADPNETRDKAFRAYRSHGGNLTLEKNRGALAHNVTALINRGYDHRIIVVAAADLGRQGTFPGYLKQRVDEIVAAGGICKNRGLDKSKLPITELEACGCQGKTGCVAWAEALRAKA